MKLAIASRPLLSAAAITSALTAGAASAAEWSLTPSGQAFALSQQNPGLAIDEDHTASAIGAQAAARIQRRTERMSFSLLPSVSLYRYQDDSDLDRNEQQLDATMSWQGERHAWMGNASAVRDTTLTSELGNTGLTQSNWRHESYSVSVGPVWQASELMSVGTRVGALAHSYPGLAQEALLNYRYNTASVYLDYSFNDRLIVSMAGAAGRLKSEGSDAHSDNTNVTFQAQYSWSPVWKLTVAAGPSWVKAGASSEQGLVFRADAKRELENSTFSLEIDRNQSPSGRGILTELEEARLRYTTRLTERLYVTGHVGLVRRKNVFRSLDVDLEDVRYRRVDMSVGWRATERWQLGFGVGHSFQRVSTLFTDGTARGFDARLTLSWSGDPYVN